MSNNSTPVNHQRNQPPAWLELIPKNIPAELLDYNQFITWQPEWREGKNGKPGKWTKIPINPRTKGRAMASTPRTWAPASQVLGHFPRVGFQFYTSDPYTMIDTDNGIDADGHIKPWAAEVMGQFPGGYWEVSVSGTGLKGIVRGHVAENRVLKNVGDGQVEIYSTGKFTTLTGHRLPESATTIGDGQEALDALVAAHTPAPRTTPRQSAVEALNLDDQVLIERVRRMQRGRALHDDGDISLYGGDHSAADQALVNYYVLAGATDEGQIDRLFRSSKLMRDKWDTRHYSDGRTYGAGTLAKALDGAVQPYEGWTRDTGDDGRRHTVPPAAPCTGDAAELLQRITALERALAQSRADNAALVELINHPVLTHAQIKIAVQAAILPRAKASHGDVDANGDAVISASEQSNDWRPKPVKQEDGVTPRLAPTNQDGTIPRLARSNVRPIMEWAIENELVPAKAIPVQRSHASGAAWHDTAWSITPAQSLADALNPWLNYQANAPKQRKPRTVPEACRECGEVHAIRHEFWCTGCGGRARPDKTVEPHEETGDKLSPVQTAPPSVALVRIGRYVISGLPEQPAYLDAAPDPLEPEPDSWEITYLQSSARDDDGMAAPPLLFDHTMPWDGEAGADRWTM